MAALVDTSVLLAAAFRRDVNHAKASALVRSTTKEQRVVAAPVLSELFYLSTVRLGYVEAVRIFALTREAFQIEALTETDMVRMQSIMDQYRQAEFDFADVAVMALAERMNIQRVFTFDHRDFTVFRLKHCAHLELLP